MKAKKKPIPVFIAVLNFDGTICVQLANRLIQIVVECVKGKVYEPTLRFSKVTGVDYNRNLLVKEFLATDCKWLIMIDHDNPPLNNPLDLIKLNKEVICLPTMMWRGVGGEDGNEGVAFNVYKKIKNGWTTMVYDGKNKLFQADRVGTGCIVIKRSVLVKMKDKAPFSSLVDKKTGIRKQGEDITFCDKARAMGIKLWGHWDYVCSHYKEVDLLDVAQLLIKVVSGEKRADQLTPIITTKR
jgi:hypothetical protein